MWTKFCGGLATTFVVGLLVNGMVAPSFAQIVVIDDDFDPMSAGGAFGSYTFGDTDAGTSSTGIGAGAGVTGDSWQTVNAAPSGANGFSGIGAQYQLGAAAGNTSADLSDYTLSFDARATGGSLSIIFQTWEDPSFGGAMTGELSTGSDLTLNADYTHYEVNLGDAGVFANNTGIDMTGGTIQLALQFNGGGATPYTNTMDVDNLMLVNAVPEPASMAFLGLGVPALMMVRRRRQAA